MLARPAIAAVVLFLLGAIGLGGAVLFGKQAIDKQGRFDNSINALPQCSVQASAPCVNDLNVRITDSRDQFEGFLGKGGSDHFYVTVAIGNPPLSNEYEVPQEAYDAMRITGLATARYLNGNLIELIEGDSIYKTDAYPSNGSDTVILKGVLSGAGGLLAIFLGGACVAIRRRVA